MWCCHNTNKINKIPWMEKISYEMSLSVYREENFVGNFGIALGRTWQ